MYKQKREERNKCTRKHIKSFSEYFQNLQNFTFFVVLLSRVGIADINLLNFIIFGLEVFLISSDKVIAKKSLVPYNQEIFNNTP